MNRSIDFHPNFIVTILQARLPICASFFSLNPEIELIYPPISIKASTSDLLENNYYWGDSFNFEMSQDKIIFKVFYKQIFFKDFLIGTCSVKVKNFFGWVNLLKDSKPAGILRICIQTEEFSQLTKKNLNYRIGSERSIKEIHKKKMKKCAVTAANSLDFSRNARKFENFGFIEEENRFEVELIKLREMTEKLISKLKLLNTQQNLIILEKGKIRQEWECIEKAREKIKLKSKKIRNWVLNINSERLFLEKPQLFEDLQENTSVNIVPLSASKPNSKFSTVCS